MSRLICLHGFGGGPESWAEVQRHMPSSWSCVCPRLYGHAPAGDVLVSEPNGIPGEAARILAMLDQDGRWRGAQHLEPHPSEPKPWLVGYSLGARVALGMLAQAPARFRGALLIGVNPGLQDEASRLLRVRADEAWACLLEQEGLDAFWRAWEGQPIFERQRLLEPHKRVQQQRLRERLDARGLAQAMRVLSLATMPDYTPLLSRLELPLHLMVGAEDLKFRALMRALQPLLPRASFEEVPGCGHNVVLESPESILSSLHRLMS